MLSNTVYARQAAQTYTLSGTINADTGTITLLTSSRPKQVTKVVNGKFSFTDSMEYPTSAWLFFYKSTDLKYRSNLFFIAPGRQTIVCQVDSSDEVPEISNKTMKEYKNFKRNFKYYYTAFDRESHLDDSIRQYYHKMVPQDLAIAHIRTVDSLTNEYNKTLKQYVKHHPDSYVAFWSFYTLLPRGFTPVFDSIFNLFSANLRNASCGKKLEEKLVAAKVVATGSKFPQMELKDMTDSSIVLPEFRKSSGYTLIDFWYSHCPPCKQQFPAFKKMYDKYKPDGFEIIGISIDQANAIDDWKKVIKEQELAWPQYRDKEKINAGNLSINYYPTNFLLDKNGIIFKRNIKIEELEKLLAEQKKPD